MPRPKSGIDAIFYTTCVEPVATRLCPVPPNAVTLVGLITAFIIGVHAMRRGDRRITGLCLILFRFYCDCLDGSMARACGTGSKLGSIFDHASDMIFMAILAVVYWKKLGRLKQQTPLQRIVGWAFALAMLAALGSVFVFEVIESDYGQIEQMVYDNLIVVQCLFFVALYIVVPPVP